MDLLAHLILTQSKGYEREEWRRLSIGGITLYAFDLQKAVTKDLSPSSFASAMPDSSLRSNEWIRCSNEQLATRSLVSHVALARSLKQVLPSLVLVAIAYVRSCRC